MAKRDGRGKQGRKISAYRPDIYRAADCLYRGNEIKPDDFGEKWRGVYRAFVVVVVGGRNQSTSDERSAMVGFTVSDLHDSPRDLALDPNCQLLAFFSLPIHV